MIFVTGTPLWIRGLTERTSPLPVEASSLRLPSDGQQLRQLVDDSIESTFQGNITYTPAIRTQIGQNIRAQLSPQTEERIIDLNNPENIGNEDVNTLGVIANILHQLGYYGRSPIYSSDGSLDPEALIRAINQFRQQTSAPGGNGIINRALLTGVFAVFNSFLRSQLGDEAQRVLVQSAVDGAFVGNNSYTASIRSQISQNIRLQLGNGTERVLDLNNDSSLTRDDINNIGVYAFVLHQLGYYQNDSMLFDNTLDVSSLLRAIDRFKESKHLHAPNGIINREIIRVLFSEFQGRAATLSGQVERGEVEYLANGRFRTRERGNLTEERDLDNNFSSQPLGLLRIEIATDLHLPTELSGFDRTEDNHRYLYLYTGEGSGDPLLPLILRLGQEADRIREENYQEVHASTGTPAHRIHERETRSLVAPGSVLSDSGRLRSILIDYARTLRDQRVPVLERSYRTYQGLLNGLNSEPATLQSFERARTALDGLRGRFQSMTISGVDQAAILFALQRAGQIPAANRAARADAVNQILQINFVHREHETPQDVLTRNTKINSAATRILHILGRMTPRDIRIIQDYTEASRAFFGDQFLPANNPGNPIPEIANVDLYLDCGYSSELLDYMMTSDFSRNMGIENIDAHSVGEISGSLRSRETEIFQTEIRIRELQAEGHPSAEVRRLLTQARTKLNKLRNGNPEGHSAHERLSLDALRARYNAARVEYYNSYLARINANPQARNNFILLLDQRRISSSLRLNDMYVGFNREYQEFRSLTLGADQTANTPLNQANLSDFRRDLTAVEGYVAGAGDEELERMGRGELLRSALRGSQSVNQAQTREQLSRFLDMVSGRLPYSNPSNPNDGILGITYQLAPYPENGTQVAIYQSRRVNPRQRVGNSDFNLPLNLFTLPGTVNRARAVRFQDISESDPFVSVLGSMIQHDGPLLNRLHAQNPGVENLTEINGRNLGEIILRSCEGRLHAQNFARIIPEGFRLLNPPTTATAPNQPVYLPQRVAIESLRRNDEILGILSENIYLNQATHSYCIVESGRHPQGFPAGFTRVTGDEVFTALNSISQNDSQLVLVFAQTGGENPVADQAIRFVRITSSGNEPLSRGSLPEIALRRMIELFQGLNISSQDHLQDINRDGTLVNAVRTLFYRYSRASESSTFESLGFALLRDTLHGPQWSALNSATPERRRRIFEMALGLASQEIMVMSQNRDFSRYLAAVGNARTSEELQSARTRLMGQVESVRQQLARGEIDLRQSSSRVTGDYNSQAAASTRALQDQIRSRTDIDMNAATNYAIGQEVNTRRSIASATAGVAVQVEAARERSNAARARQDREAGIQRDELDLRNQARTLTPNLIDTFITELGLRASSRDVIMPSMVGVYFNGASGEAINRYEAFAEGGAEAVNNLLPEHIGHGASPQSLVVNGRFLSVLWDAFGAQRTPDRTAQGPEPLSASLERARQDPFAAVGRAIRGIIPYVNNRNPFSTEPSLSRDLSTLLTTNPVAALRLYVHTTYNTAPQDVSSVVASSSITEDDLEMVQIAFQNSDQTDFFRGLGNAAQGIDGQRAADLIGRARQIMINPPLDLTDPAHVRRVRFMIDETAIQRSGEIREGDPRFSSEDRQAMNFTVTLCRAFYYKLQRIVQQSDEQTRDAQAAQRRGQVGWRPNASDRVGYGLLGAFSIPTPMSARDPEIVDRARIGTLKYRLFTSPIGRDHGRPVYLCDEHGATVLQQLANGNQVITIVSGHETTTLPRTYFEGEESGRIDRVFIREFVRRYGGLLRHSAVRQMMGQHPEDTRNLIERLAEDDPIRFISIFLGDVNPDDPTTTQEERALIRAGGNYDGPFSSAFLPTDSSALRQVKHLMMMALLQWHPGMRDVPPTSRRAIESTAMLEIFRRNVEGEENLSPSGLYLKGFLLRQVGQGALGYGDGLRLDDNSLNSQSINLAGGHFYRRVMDFSTQSMPEHAPRMEALGRFIRELEASGINFGINPRLNLTGDQLIEAQYQVLLNAALQLMGVHFSGRVNFEGNTLTPSAGFNGLTQVGLNEVADNLELFMRVIMPSLEGGERGEEPTITIEDSFARLRDAFSSQPRTANLNLHPLRNLVRINDFSTQEEAWYMRAIRSTPDLLLSGLEERAYLYEFLHFELQAGMQYGTLRIGASLYRAITNSEGIAGVRHSRYFGGRALEDAAWGLLLNRLGFMAFTYNFLALWRSAGLNIMGGGRGSIKGVADSVFSVHSFNGWIQRVRRARMLCSGLGRARMARDQRRAIDVLTRMGVAGERPSEVPEGRVRGTRRGRFIAGNIADLAPRALETASQPITELWRAGRYFLNRSEQWEQLLVRAGANREGGYWGRMLETRRAERAMWRQLDNLSYAGEEGVSLDFQLPENEAQPGATAVLGEILHLRLHSSFLTLLRRSSTAYLRDTVVTFGATQRRGILEALERELRANSDPAAVLGPDANRILDRFTAERFNCSSIDEARQMFGAMTVDAVRGNTRSLIRERVVAALGEMVAVTEARATANHLIPMLYGVNPLHRGTVASFDRRARGGAAWDSMVRLFNREQRNWSEFGDRVADLINNPFGWGRTEPGIEGRLAEIALPRDAVVDTENRPEFRAAHPSFLRNGARRLQNNLNPRGHLRFSSRAAFVGEVSGRMMRARIRYNGRPILLEQANSLAGMFYNNYCTGRMQVAREQLNGVAAELQEAELNRPEKRTAINTSLDTFDASFMASIETYISHNRQNVNINEPTHGDTTPNETTAHSVNAPAAEEAGATTTESPQETEAPRDTIPSPPPEENTSPDLLNNTRGAFGRTVPRSISLAVERIGLDEGILFARANAIIEAPGVDVSTLGARERQVLREAITNLRSRIGFSERVLIVTQGYPPILNTIDLPRGVTVNPESPTLLIQNGRPVARLVVNAEGPYRGNPMILIEFEAGAPQRIQNSLNRQVMMENHLIENFRVETQRISTETGIDAERIIDGIEQRVTRSITEMQLEPLERQARIERFHHEMGADRAVFSESLPDLNRALIEDLHVRGRSSAYNLSGLRRITLGNLGRLFRTPTNWTEVRSTAGLQGLGLLIAIAPAIHHGISTRDYRGAFIQAGSVSAIFSGISGASMFVERVMLGRSGNFTRLIGGNAVGIGLGLLLTAYNEREHLLSNDRHAQMGGARELAFNILNGTVSAVAGTVSSAAITPAGGIVFGAGMYEGLRRFEEIHFPNYEAARGRLNDAFRRLGINVTLGSDNFESFYATSEGRTLLRLAEGIVAFDGVVTQSDFSDLGGNRSVVWNALRERGYINGRGEIQDRFDSNRENFSLGNPSLHVIEQRVFDILSASRGIFSVEQRNQINALHLNLNLRNWNSLSVSRFLQIISSAEEAVSTAKSEHPENWTGRTINETQITLNGPERVETYSDNLGHVIAERRIQDVGINLWTRRNGQDEPLNLRASIENRNDLVRAGFFRGTLYRDFADQISLQALLTHGLEVSAESTNLSRFLVIRYEVQERLRLLGVIGFTGEDAVNLVQGNRLERAIEQYARERRIPVQRVNGHIVINTAFAEQLLRDTDPNHQQIQASIPTLASIEPRMVYPTSTPEVGGYRDPSSLQILRENIEPALQLVASTDPHISPNINDLVRARRLTNAYRSLRTGYNLLPADSPYRRSLRLVLERLQTAITILREPVSSSPSIRQGQVQRRQSVINYATEALKSAQMIVRLGTAEEIIASVQTSNQMMHDTDRAEHLRGALSIYRSIENTLPINTPTRDSYEIACQGIEYAIELLTQTIATDDGVRGQQIILRSDALESIQRSAHVFSLNDRMDIAGDLIHSAQRDAAMPDVIRAANLESTITTLDLMVAEMPQNDPNNQNLLAVRRMREIIVSTARLLRQAPSNDRDAEIRGRITALTQSATAFDRARGLVSERLAPPSPSTRTETPRRNPPAGGPRDAGVDPTEE